MCKRLKRLLHAVSSTDEDDMMPTASNVRGASAALPPHVLATVTSHPHPHSTHRKHPRPHSCRRRPAWPLSIIDAPSVPPSAHHAIIIPAEHGLYHCCLSPRLSPTRCTHRPSPFCPALSCSRPFATSLSLQRCPRWVLSAMWPTIRSSRSAARNDEHRLP